MRLSPKAVLKCVLWVWLLSGCTAAQVEKGEDTVCSFIAREYPKLPEGKVKDYAAATAIACDLEEAAEHADAGADSGH